MWPDTDTDTETSPSREHASVYRQTLMMTAAVVLTAAVGGCALAPRPGPQTAAHHAHASKRHHAGRGRHHKHQHQHAHPAAAVRVLVEPHDGIGPIYRLITKARHSVDLTMYELIDPRAEADLAADAKRGVDVRVILDQHLEKSRNTATYHYLTAHKVHVHWAPAGTTYHQKTLTVDNRTSAIMTLNLVQSDYAGTRDFAVIDTHRADVRAIVTTFDADFAGRHITPPDGTDLVWSPTNAESSILSVIRGARHTLAVEDEEMSDPAVTSALAAAARRGVRVSITMTADSEWDGAFSQLARAGAHIRLYPDDSSALYIHAKAIVADAGRSGQQVLVGSQNFSVASLGYNRELGIRTRFRPAVTAISRTLAHDFAGAKPYGQGGGSGGSGTGKSRASCRATARVYQASRHENDVYVHSNRPHQKATARADGHSGSYETNGSGYAVIYLNGPPAGARITVTVGGATCTTRD
jgi:phosphatidylserine/phosphatidylglycerophosphate/cardiolipin synthase-like enzyme